MDVNVFLSFDELLRWTFSAPELRSLGLGWAEVCLGPPQHCEALRGLRGCQEGLKDSKRERF